MDGASQINHQFHFMERKKKSIGRERASDLPVVLWRQWFIQGIRLQEGSGSTA